MDHKTLSKKIADGFAGLSAQLQRAARYVLDRPDDVALMSMRRLAEKAGVHPSSMVRLAQAFGFDGYQEFRQVFQNRLRVRPRNYVRRARDLQSRRGADKKHTLVEDMMSAGEENLRETFARNGAEGFATAAAMLLRAPRIFVVGARSAFLVAYYLEYAMRMFRDDVILLGGSGGTFGDRLRSLRSGDVVLAVGFEPYSFDTVRAVAYGRDNGARSVVLTDSPVSPLVKAADHVLLIHNESPAVFNSVSAILTAAETLVALMVQEGGETALSAIRDAEKQLNEFDAYWRGDAALRGRAGPPKGARPSRRKSKS
jgi:DNA-binding MurR/RpiR family transcriptional regulator